MPNMTMKGLENTIKQCIKLEDYQTARNYIENYADKIKEFDKEKALKQVKDAEKGIKPTQKVEKTTDKEE